MRKVYMISDAIISPLGFSTEENIQNLRLETTGIKEINDARLWSEPFYGAQIHTEKLEEAWSVVPIKQSYTRLEKMMILSVIKLIEENPYLNMMKCGIIISTTKGNIDALKDQNRKEYLDSIAKTIQHHFSLKTKPIILSNACISGGLALAVGKRMIQSGEVDDMVVIGGDILSEFTLSGFFSFQAISKVPCKPFCKNRTGISLGEAAAAVWISSRSTINTANGKEAIIISGDASANDANHISGPSRTGEGLYISIQRALKEAGCKSKQIDHINAHGTATMFNDEMEAIAFNRAELQHTPVTSLKGYYGHTLGASALIESIIAKHCLLNNELFASYGFEELGVSPSIDIVRVHRKQEIRTILKTASGFGGCNVALVLEKVTI
ncbi:beta-ketoacyl synthase N-terminal-like domain-containing protein [Aquimarina addita]|uniref:Beta-ketoacyl synthase N-terminal-like domain-containing protein n=1 Tax=Aquimarina addita TaxID=870485 RepID=A0ABP6UJZ2_9FLAO